MADIGALSQFEGATVLRVKLGRHHTYPVSVHMTLRLKDGSERDLEVYTIRGDSMLHVRVDGMFVPPEELP